MKTTAFTDDIDGAPGARPIMFAVDGTGYEIDLAAHNIDALNEALAPFVSKGRKIKTPGRSPRTRARQAPDRRTTSDPPATSSSRIRDWWKTHPADLPTWQARGAIPAAVLRAHAESQRQ